MEENGLITRKHTPRLRKKVEYTLTETGYNLKMVLGAM